MKQYKFSLKDECMKELPALKEPQRSDKKYLGLAGWENYFKEDLKWFYLEANNLQSIPVPKEHLSSFTDGKIYNEDEFEIKGVSENKISDSTYIIEIGKFVYPKSKQKVDDTELWNEVLNALGYGFVNREKFIKEAQEHYTKQENK